MFVIFMDLFHCKKKKITLHILKDGVRIDVVGHYFHFKNILPDLGGREWYVRNHGEVKSWNREVRSMYTSLTFIINEDDDRIFFHFEQVTRFYFGGQWIDTC
jgi:hypothetical protein